MEGKISGLSPKIFFVKKSDVISFPENGVRLKSGSAFSELHVESRSQNISKTVSASFSISDRKSVRRLRKFCKKELSMCMEKEYAYERRKRHQRKAPITLKEWMTLREHGSRLSSVDLAKRGIGLVWTVT